MFTINKLQNAHFYLRMQKRLVIFIFLLLSFFTQYAFADNIANLDSNSAIAARETVIANLFWATTQIGRIIGMIVLIAGFYRMRMKAEMGPNGNISTTSIFVYIAVGFMMLSFSSTLGSLIATFLGQTSTTGAGACFILNDSVTGGRSTLDNGSCWNASSSELTGTLMDRVTKMSSASTAQEFLANINVIIGLFQLIGFIYFFVGMHGLVAVSKGSARNGYFKPLVIIIASALIVDLPHTAEIFLNTLKKVGINF